MPSTSAFYPEAEMPSDAPSATPASASLRRAGTLARSLWDSPIRGQAIGLLLIVIALTVFTVWLEVQLNTWQASFYNALQAKNIADFWQQMIRFCELAAAFIVAAVYRQYLQQMLQIRWRQQLTHHLTARWLRDHAHYRMQLAPQAEDNPDQRIAEDAGLFVSSTLDLLLDFINALLTLVSFIAILWVLSSEITLHLGSRDMTVPGYLVWVALIYALAGSWLTQRVGRPLIALNFGQQRAEADFRFALARMREHGDAIALQRGEVSERRHLRERFAQLVHNWRAIMTRQKRLTWVTSAYGQIAIVFPYFAAAPAYFLGRLTLGGLMQGASAFGKVQDALSWFITAYASIANWRATVERIARFEDAAAAAHSETEPRIELATGAANALRITDLLLALPDGCGLTHIPELVVNRGDWLLIEGPSGIGKSTLLRACAGVWRYGSGRIELPSPRPMFVPQRPYLPLGSLRTALAYPRRPNWLSDQTAREALEAVGLAALCDSLDLEARWHTRLSLGEQQRIAFARVLLQRPAWVFLDEATSAVDITAEAQLYGLLRAARPDSTVISVGHRTSLRALHTRHTVLEAHVSAATLPASEFPSEQAPETVPHGTNPLDATPFPPPAFALKETMP